MIRPPERASFDQVTGLVWLGSRLGTFADYRRLRSAGIKACVDMKLEGADPWSFESFLWLPTPDHEAPSQFHLRLGLAFLRECVREQTPVVVACHAGVGRSSTLVLAYLMTTEFKDAPQSAALAYLKSKRCIASPNPEQLEAAQLAAFAHAEQPA